MPGSRVCSRTFPLPGDPTHYPRPAPVRVEHVSIAIALDFEKKEVAGAVTLRVRSARDGVENVRLDAHEMDILSVRTEAGATLPHHREDGIVVVALGRALGDGERLVLVVDYSAKPRRGLYFVRADQAWTQGEPEDTHYWFPCVDQPGAKATSEMRVTVPDGLFALSNGDLVGTRREGGSVAYHWKHDIPHPAYLVSLAVGRFSESKEEAEGVALHYYFPPGREADAKRAFGRTADMVRAFNRLLGVPYPYGKYAQVVVDDFIFGGMENTTATTMHDFILYDERAALDFTADPIVAHELAHQWFGDLVTCRHWSDAWLNEGFATFFEFVDREVALGRDEADFYRLEASEGYFDEDAARYRRPIVARSYRDPIDLFDRHLYNKGGLVLAMLRARLGDAVFWKSVRLYLERHRAGSVETVDLVRAFEDGSGESLGRFFDQWVYRGGHPEITVTSEWIEDQKLARISVEQTQAGEDGTDAFEFDVDVRFAASGGETLTRRIRIRSRKETFSVPLPERPARIAVDPADAVLKRMTLDLSVQTLAASLAAEPEAIARARAAQALGKKGGPDAVAALAAALGGDPFWGVRAESARALGALKSEAALGALLGAIPGASAPGTPHARVRRAIVRALGEFREERCVAALLGHLAKDASSLVEAESARSLGKTRSPRAFDALSAAVGRPAHQDAIAVGCLDGLGELRDARGLPIAIEWAAAGRPPYARRAACVAIAKLGEGKQVAREALEFLLSDADFRARSAAARALAALKDPDAIGALDAALGRESEARVVRALRETLRDLREGRTRTDEVSHLRDDLDKLRQENRTLLDRLEKLEAAQGRG